MIPDLGKYGTEVMAAYIITILLLVILVAVSLRKSIKAKRLLEIQEEKVRAHGR